MTNTNISNFRKDLFSYVEQTVKYNEPVNVSTKIGNVVLLSESDYEGLMETLYLYSIPGMVESILASKDEPRDEYSYQGDLTLDEYIDKLIKRDEEENK